MEGSWIWIGDNQGTENERVCFVKHFDVQNLMNDVTLQITAVTKYQVFINGKYPTTVKVSSSVEISATV